MYNLKKKKLLKHGYGKLDKLISDINNLNQIEQKEFKKNILIAPTWGESSIVKSSLEDIVKILLDNSFNVTVRFHPMTIKQDKKVLKNLRKQFLNVKNFKLDDKMNNSESYINSNND